MDKDKTPQQGPKVAENHALDGPQNQSIWQSAFEAKVTPAVPPPAAAITAQPAEGEHQAHEGDYEPDTVVFEIGGHADPQNPGEPNGKGIKVVMPPGLDSQTALVHAVMAMLRCSASEAQIAIQKEKIVWTNYKPEGHGTDRAGNVIHLIQYKQKYVERVGHEPKTLKPIEGDELLAFKHFKLYLQDHDSDHIRDPEVQYDRMAKDEGWYVAEPPFTIEEDDWHVRRKDYERLRSKVVEFVVWERLRAKRESLAQGIPQESSSAKSLVEAMADRLPSLIDMGAMQYYMPARYFNAWAKLHPSMIVAQGTLEQGDTHAFQHGGLVDSIYQLAYWFAEFAQTQLGVTKSDASVEYSKFSATHVATISQLAKAKEPTLEQGMQLLVLYYKLTFAMVEAAGRLMAHGNEKTMLQSQDNQDLRREGKTIENQGKAGTAMLGLVAEHPNAQRVQAKFYPEKSTKDFRQGGDMGNDDWTEGIDIDLFLYHDATTGEWVLEDFTHLADQKSNRAKGAADAPVPAALFDELNSKLRFPKGALFYRVPDEGSYRILRTTEPLEISEWLRWAAMAGLAVGLAAMSLGATVPAEIVMIGSAVAMAGAEAVNLAEENEQGMLTRERVLVHSAMIASCILGGSSAGLGMLTKAGIVVPGASITRIVAGMQVAADGVCVAVFTTEAFEGLSAAADDPEGLTFTRLLAFFLQMGMNGLMLYGMKGALGEAAGVGKAGGESKAGLGTEAGGKGKRYRPKPKPQSRGSRKASSTHAASEGSSSVLSAELQAHPAFKALNKAKRAELERSMAADADFAAAIHADPSLIKPWASIVDLVELKTSIEYLRALKGVLDNTHLQKHLFYGDFKIPTRGRRAGIKTASGMHSEVGIKSGRVRVKPSEGKTYSSTNSEVWEAKVERRDETNGAWIPKSNNNANSTFFPPSWSKTRTLEEVAFVYKKILSDKSGTFVDGNEFSSWSFDGTIEMHFFLQTDDKIISAFPVISH